VSQLRTMASGRIGITMAWTGSEASETWSKLATINGTLAISAAIVVPTASRRMPARWDDSPTKSGASAVMPSVVTHARLLKHHLPDSRVPTQRRYLSVLTPLCPYNATDVVAPFPEGQTNAAIKVITTVMEGEML
jgi:hypothetical protein